MSMSSSLRPLTQFKTCAGDVTQAVYAPVAGVAASRPTGVASRPPARARWSVSLSSGGSSGGVARSPAPSPCRSRRTGSRSPRPPSSSPAGPRSSAGATRAAEPRSTARAGGRCRWSHRAGAKAGLSAASTSFLTEGTSLLSFSLGDKWPSFLSLIEPLPCLCPLSLLSSPPPLSLSLSCIIHDSVTWWGVYIIFSQKSDAVVNSWISPAWFDLRSLLLLVVLGHCVLLSYFSTAKDALCIIFKYDHPAVIGIRDICNNVQ